MGLYQYVEKPWDNDDLRLVIRNGLEKRQLIAKLSQRFVRGNPFVDMGGDVMYVIVAPGMPI